MTDNAQEKPDSNVNFVSRNKQTMTLENKNGTSWSDPKKFKNQKNLMNVHHKQFLKSSSFPFFLT